MRTFISIILYCSLLAMATGAWAQDTGVLEGTVTDQQSGETLPGVNISIMGTSQGTATNAEGVYRIEGLEPGEYRVRATYVGYAEFQSEPLTIEGGETTTLDIALEQTRLRGNEIVVSGTKRPEKMLESPTTIERVSEEEISSSGGSTFMNAMANLKGVNFQNAGVNTQLISARGFQQQF